MDFSIFLQQCMLQHSRKQKKDMRDAIKPVAMDLSSDRQINRCRHWLRIREGNIDIIIKKWCIKDDIVGQTNLIIRLVSAVIFYSNGISNIFLWEFLKILNWTK